MKKEVILLRISSNDKAVYGIMLVLTDNRMTFECRTIENKSKIFPPGTYPIKNEWSPQFKKKLWELYKVPGRAEIKIHAANYYKQLDGCIGVGLNHQDIDKDGVDDVISSNSALDKFRIEMIGIEDSTIKVIDLASI